jgi:hypothetical protein
MAEEVRADITAKQKKKVWCLSKETLLLTEKQIDPCRSARS